MPIFLSAINRLQTMFNRNAYRNSLTCKDLNLPRHHSYSIVSTRTLKISYNLSTFCLTVGLSFFCKDSTSLLSSLIVFSRSSIFLSDIVELKIGGRKCLFTFTVTVKPLLVYFRKQFPSYYLK